MNNASFALGYASAEDRLWQMDIFRHAARGTLSEFVGAGEDDAFLKMDIATRREGYTEDEIRKMFERLDDKFGSIGLQVQEGLAAYADGVNAYIDELRIPGRVAERPVEYEATGNPFPVFPQPWSKEDTLFLVVLQLRVFGETAGGELDNAALFAHLRNRLGGDLGPRMLRSARGARGSRMSEARAIVAGWIDAGAHRRNRDRDDDMDAGTAVAIFDRWYKKTVHKMFDDELGGRGYGLVAAPVTDPDMWFDFSSYRDRVFARGRAGMARHYCDVRGTGRSESCRQIVVRSLRETIAELTRAQGSDPSGWTAPAEWIEFQKFGAGSVERIPWQNRGTHNHVVETLD